MCLPNGCTLRRVLIVRSIGIAMEGRLYTILYTSAMQGADLWGSTQTGRADKGNSSGTNAADLAALCVPVDIAMVAL